MVDPFTASIITGVVANAMYTVGKGLLRRARDTSLPPVAERVAQLSSVSAALQEAAKAYNRSSLTAEPKNTELLQEFLASPEVEAMTRQIFACRLTDSGDVTIASVRASFASSMAAWLSVPQHGVTEVANATFEALVEAAERTLELQMQNGNLSAHDARSTLRFRLLRDELKAIEEQLAFFQHGLVVDPHKIMVFEKRYREEVGRRHSTITPPNLDTARRYPINRIYVSSSFYPIPLSRSAQRGARRSDSTVALTLSGFLSAAYRVVILGNPGGGKSTLAAKLCHDLSARYEERLLARRKVTPILVVLRDYGSEKKAHGCSILQFIERKANSTYQVPPPPGAFEYMLQTGRAFVIFDGLDELLETSYRQEVSGDVESFCRQYPAVPVLVTSREVGYDQAPLDPETFDAYGLAEFNQDQIEEYATKWFTLESDLPSDERQLKVNNFMWESAAASDIRSNPLMLGLMCNIYRGQGYIPRNRPDVYEKCAVMLFDRWDKSRNIRPDLPFEAHIRPTMMHLAHWIYADEQLEGGVPEVKLVAEAASYLEGRRFEIREEAYQAAERFIEFCRGRAWVFTDTGTTRDGERLYQFTHRTFLEYFAAAHLVRTQPTAAKLGAVLFPHIALREWDVVAQLAFQMLGNQQEGASDELLRGLLNEALSNREAAVNLLSFAARCLSFLVPHRDVVREIASMAIELAIEIGFDRSMFRKSSIRTGRVVKSPVRELTSSLLQTTIENRPTLADAIVISLTRTIKGADNLRSAVAFEILMTLRLLRHTGRDPQVEAVSFWDEVREDLFAANTDRAKDVAKEHLPVALLLISRGEIDPSFVFEYYGAQGFFRRSHSQISVGLVGGTVADRILARIPLDGTGRQAADVGHLGRLLITAPAPWIQREEIGLLPYVTRATPSREEFMIVLPVDSESLFGAFALLAPWFEIHEEEDLAGMALPPFDTLLPLLRSRSHGNVDVLDLERNGFTLLQQSFVMDWARGELTLVGGTKKRGYLERQH